MSTTVASLLSLPGELLSVIASELPLADLLEVRTTCQAFHKACETLQVWRRLFHRSIGVTLPQPFFLPKPFEECTARDLERAIRRWDAPWLPSAPMQTIRRDAANASLDYCPFITSSMIMSPGGRWVLLRRQDGSVWYLDLSQDWTSTAPVETRLLIPALEPLPGGHPGWGDIRVTLAVDWASEEALGSSSAGCFLTQFNIAVFVCDTYARPSAKEPMRVNIWNVLVQDGPCGSQLSLGKHLSTFSGEARQGVKEARLYGPALAYRMCDHRVSIVHWREVNGKRFEESLPGRCVATRPRVGRGLDPPDIRSMHLLPGNRILIALASYRNAEFTLHNWENDYPLSNISASHREACTSSCRWNPVWQFVAPYSSVYFTPQQPSIILDTIRMVLPTEYALYGLTIPVHDHSRDAVQVIPLVEGHFDRGGYAMQVFALQRAVGLRRQIISDDMFYAQYRWTGEHTKESASAGFRVIDSPLDELDSDSECDELSAGTALFDQFTNRVVVVNRSATRFYTIFTTKFTSEGQPTLDWSNSDDEYTGGSPVHQSRKGITAGEAPARQLTERGILDDGPANFSLTSGPPAMSNPMRLKRRPGQGLTKSTSDATSEGPLTNVAQGDHLKRRKAIGLLRESPERNDGTEGYDGDSEAECNSGGQAGRVHSAYAVDWKGDGFSRELSARQHKADGHNDALERGGSDEAVSAGRSDDEISWKGIGSVGEHSDEELGGDLPVDETSELKRRLEWKLRWYRRLRKSKRRHVRNPR